MPVLHLVLDGEEVELSPDDVHYLVSDDGRLRVSRTPGEDAELPQLGHFTTVLGRWFFSAANVPAARGLFIDDQPCTNGRREVNPERTTLSFDGSVPTGPFNKRAGAGPDDPPPAPISVPRRRPPSERDGRRRPPPKPPTPPSSTLSRRYVIGRAGTGADIEVDDPLVKARHATVRIDGKGRWWFAGPVYVDGTRQMSATLVEGEVFVVGQTALTVSRDLLPADDRPATTVPRQLGVFNRRRPTSETGLAIRLDGVTVVADDGNKRLDDVHLSIEAGEMVAVVGPSGAGKSSLIKVLLGDLPPTVGTVHIGPPDGRVRDDPKLRRQQVRYVPQQDQLYEGLTVRETLTYAARLRAASDTRPREITARVDEVLRRLTLDEGKLPDRRVKKLSGGQKRRVSIGLELVGDPKLLLLDEPTSGLDPGKDRGIMQDLRRVSDDTHCTVLLVTHATEHLGHVDKVVVIAKGGRVRYVGPPADVLSTLGHANWADLMVELDAEPKKDPRAPAPAHRVPGADIVTTLSMRGFWTALLRQAKVTVRRGKGWLIPMLTAPMVCTFIAVVASADGLRPGRGMTQVLAILVTVAALAGASLTYLDLVNDADILQRDWRVGIEVLPILLAKVVVFSAMCGLLSTVVALFFDLFRQLPEPAYAVPPLGMLLAVCFLIMLASMGLGLLISAVSPTSEKAVTWSTLLAVLQVALSGSLFHLPAWLTPLTLALPARLGLAAIASYADLNAYRRPALYEDWLWRPGAWMFLLLLVALAAVFAAGVTGSIVWMQRRWRRG